MASAPDHNTALDNWQVGQHVYIAGTGRWWAGSSFGARIVDVSMSDATLKVPEDEDVTVIKLYTAFIQQHGKPSLKNHLPEVLND